MKFPRWTLLLAALALAAFLLPELHNALVFDRAHLARGEWWRLASGHLTHFSGWHLGYNLAALIVVGALIETRHHPRYLLLLTGSSIAIGGVLYLALPAMHRYGGLSGVVTASLVYLCLCELRRADSARALWLATLLALGIKLAMEYATGTTLLAQSEALTFVPLPLAHLLGAFAAVVVFALARPWRVRTLPPFDNASSARPAG